MTDPRAFVHGWAKPLACVALILLGAVILWREPPTKPLVPADGWEVSGGFVPIDPPTKDLRKSAASDPQSRYWRSWSAELGSQPGTLRTKPFIASGSFAVPYNGFSGEPGVSTFIECVDDGRKFHLATSRTNTQWSEVWIERPETLCKGALRVVAVSTSTKDYVALGTPYQLSWLSALKHSSLAGFWFLTLSWCVVAGWFLLFGRLAVRWMPRITPAFAGLVGVGLIGYVQFFVYWYQPRAGLLLTAGLAITGTWISIRTLFGKPGPLRDGPQGELQSLRFAACLWLAIALAYFALVTMVDSGAGAWEVNGRFTPARWSSDNQLPGFVSRMLASGKHDDLSDFAPWSIADRPPLSYGWHATLHDLFARLTRLNDGAMYFARYQLAIGIVLNTSWAALLALVLPALGLSRARALLVILVLSLCPLFIFNSVYAWPKLLSGTLTLAAAWILLGLENPARRLRDDNGGLIAAAALSALGLLTHGGSAFGIVVALAFAAVFRGLPSVRGAVVAAVTAFALLVPWSLWQSAYHSGGNALVKFAFAGTFGFGEEHVGVADTILRSYHDLGWDAWLTKKRDGLLTVLFGIRNSCTIHEAGHSYSLIDGWRAADFYKIVPSLNFLILGLLSLGVFRTSRPGNAAPRQASVRLVAFGIASVAFNWLVTWDCFIVHHQSYQALIALHLGLVLALLSSGRWGGWVLALNVAYGVVVWVVEPLKHFARFDLIASVTLLTIATLAVRALRLARQSHVEARS